jgi:hypothetical protein
MRPLLERTPPSIPLVIVVSIANSSDNKQNKDSTVEQSPTPQPQSQLPVEPNIADVQPTPEPVLPPTSVATQATLESDRQPEVAPVPAVNLPQVQSQSPSTPLVQSQEIVPSLEQNIGADSLVEGAPAEASFAWQASEYIHHEKTLIWYVVLTIIFFALLAIAYFTKQWLSIGVFIVMAVAIVVYARKPPRTLTYELGNDGISVDGHLYPFDQFRTFAVLPDLSWHTIDLEPTRRFMPRLSILFETENFDEVVGHLSQYLPRVDRQPDAVERLTRYLRF